MRLTSLEIKGFKSFGDKVTIHFDKGVTSIVGPNGSGKSNVVDSIRWVLGEQKTRMLRSEKMENIIFNGNKNRKPASLAEVSLSFENTKNILPTEYSTVTITRRLYRTGESEYLLNNVTCRLKDITDLFLDTGIGSDSYAIIELKMVDEILNDKHNAIKNLLEEAAGPQLGQPRAPARGLRDDALVARAGDRRLPDGCHQLHRQNARVPRLGAGPRGARRALRPRARDRALRGHAPRSRLPAGDAPRGARPLRRHDRGRVPLPGPRAGRPVRRPRSARALHALPVRSDLLARRPRRAPPRARGLVRGVHAPRGVDHDDPGQP